ncbi:MAG TPA: carboxypeptidase-like regulatory domain-containing protein [Terracidiphilus sp.]|nr:carboxypeptidase-like regulatory domain-containing protein [Terracidiphilus sp.]
MRRWAPALFLAIACAGVWGQAAVPAPTAPAAAGEYTISGVVVNERTGQALPRVTMTLGDTAKRRIAAQTTTDEEGSFRFDHLATGRFDLVGERHGYVTQSYQQHEGGVSTAILTGEGKPSTGLRFTMRQQATVFGNVVEDSGDPVPRAQVLLFAKQQVGGTEKIAMVHQETANEAGEYEMTHLVPGSYYLCATGTPWYAQRMGMGRRAEADAPRSPLDVSYGTTCYPGATDPAEAEMVDVRAGDRLELPVTMHAVPSVRVVMRIPAGPQGQVLTIPSFRTEIFGTTEFVQAGGLSIMPSPDADHSDAEHRELVATANLAPGQYQATFQGQNGQAERVMALNAGAETVALDSAAAVEEAGVSGTAAMADGGAIPRFLTVSLYRAVGDRHAAEVHPGGDFRIGSVPAGEYELRVESGVGRLGIAQMSAKGAALRGGVLTVGAEPVTLNLSVFEGTGTVAGVVQSGNATAGGVFLLLVPEDRHAPAVANQSDSDGSFEFQHVLPGKYTAVAIEDGWTLQWGSRDVVEHYLAGGERITVPNEARTVTLPEPLQAQAK